MKHLLATLLTLAGYHQVFALEYEVDGQIEQTIYNQDGGVATFHSSQFTVFVRDCSWLIRTIQKDANGIPVSASETACVNGTEIYQLSGLVDGENDVIGRSYASQNSATIVSNSVPVGQTEGSYVGHIWLMFASGCWLAQQSTSEITPVYDLNASAPGNPALKRHATWELVVGPGSLPLNVVYSKPVNSVDSTLRIDATYAASGVTNAGTIKIPNGFVFEKRTDYGFAPGTIPPGWSTPAYHVFKRDVATVTAVRPVCSRSDLTPVAKGRTMVIDERQLEKPWAGSKLSYYVVQDGVQWLPIEKAKEAYVVPRAPPNPAQSNSARLKPASPNPVQSNSARLKPASPNPTPLRPAALTPAQPKPVSRRIVAIILLLPLAVISLFLWLKRKKE